VLTLHTSVVKPLQRTPTAYNEMALLNGVSDIVKGKKSCWFAKKRNANPKGIVHSGEF
jgi:hypothetical protein